MKRQHPTDPNLFWCPKCRAYKARSEFNNKKTNHNGINSYCKACHARDCGERRKGAYRLRHNQLARERYIPSSRILLTEYEKKQHARSWFKNNPGKVKILESLKRLNLPDSYLRARLKIRGIADAPAELIELTRQGIIMKRTLKQFKKWREENESNCAHV